MTRFQTLSYEIQLTVNFRKDLRHIGKIKQSCSSVKGSARNRLLNDRDAECLCPVFYDIMQSRNCYIKEFRAIIR